mmetsp:Transcript_1542/g.2896  ORF Transcript_1542/g.2896 Transcript_1542/m.2896 type:complete len:309 (-) Transcript_1542:869-1795(-)
MPHSACNEHGSSSASPFEQLLLCSTSSSSSNAAGFLLLVSRRHEHRRLAVQRQVNERRLLQPGLSINLDVQRLEQLQAKLCHLSDAQQVRVADCAVAERDVEREIREPVQRAANAAHFDQPVAKVMSLFRRLAFRLLRARLLLDVLRAPCVAPSRMRRDIDEHQRLELWRQDERLPRAARLAAAVDTQPTGQLRHLCSPRQSVPPHEELVLDPAVELLRLRLALHVEGVQGRRLEPDAYVVAEQRGGASNFTLCRRRPIAGCRSPRLEETGVGWRAVKRALLIGTGILGARISVRRLRLRCRLIVCAS